MTQTTRRYFEYLAVAIVLAVFAMILLPVYGGSRSSIAGRCVNNIKQLTLAQLMYASDHDERLPLATTWYTAIYPTYVKTPDRACPLAPGGQYGYAMLDRMSGLDTAQVKDPASEVLIIESAACLPNAHGDESLAPRPGRHAGKNMVGYLDGRAMREDLKGLVQRR